MAQYIQKKFQQTPLKEGLVENSLQSGSPVNAPSIEAVLKELYHPNLLINGDFQINQRGQSEYETSVNQYTLDMWASISNNSLIRINPNKKVGGVYTNSAIMQYVVGNLENKTVTLVIKIGGIVATKTFECKVGYTAVDVITTDNFKLVVSNNVLSERDLTRIEFYFENLQGEVFIEYIDLFEGDIAYPHVKEDYAIALMRCQRKLLAFNNTSVGIGNFYNNIVYATIFIPTSLDNVPTISLNGYRFIIDGMDVANITNVVFGSMSQNLIYVKLTLEKSFNSSMNGLSGRIVARGTGDEFMCFSCEPL